MAREVVPLRSRLFVPGNKKDWMQKAICYDSDALVLDLEDSVPDSDKGNARNMVAEFIGEYGQKAVLFVRINDLSSSAAMADLRRVVGPGLAGVIVPKVDGPADIVFVSRILGWLELDSGIDPGTVVVDPVLETARGIREAYAIGNASRRVAYMGGIGVRGGDEERALGYRWSSTGEETFTIRSQVLLDARAAGVPNPMTGLWTDVEDLVGLRAFAQEGKKLGYEGMTAIHPGHLAIINEVFSPSDEELEYYRGLLAAMDVAEGNGTSATMYRGVMVDTAMSKTARSRLARASKETHAYFS